MWEEILKYGNRIWMPYVEQIFKDNPNTWFGARELLDKLHDTKLNTRWIPHINKMSSYLKANENYESKSKRISSFSADSSRNVNHYRLLNLDRGRES